MEPDSASVDFTSAYHMAVNPSRKLFKTNFTRGHLKNNLFLVINRGAYFEVVQHKEDLHSRMTCPLVTVHEWMVLDHEESQRRGLGRRYGVKLLPVEDHARLRDSSFQPSQVSDAMLTAKPLHDTTMKIDYF